MTVGAQRSNQSSSSSFINLPPMPQPDHGPQHASNDQSMSVSQKAQQKEHVPTLSRNQACRTCRSRKVRCDAQKPGCGACRKTATVQGRDPDQVVCEYDTEDNPGNPPRKRKYHDITTQSRNAEGSKRTNPNHSQSSTPSDGITASVTHTSGRGGGQKLTSDKKVADLVKTIAELQQELQQQHDKGHTRPDSNIFTDGSVPFQMASAIGAPPQPQQEQLHLQQQYDWSSTVAAGNLPPAFMLGSNFSMASMPSTMGAGAMGFGNGTFFGHGLTDGLSAAAIGAGAGPAPATAVSQETSPFPPQQGGYRRAPDRSGVLSNSLSPIARTDMANQSGQIGPSTFTLPPAASLHPINGQLPQAEAQTGIFNAQSRRPSIVPNQEQTSSYSSHQLSSDNMHQHQLNTLPNNGQLADSDFFGLFWPNWPPSLPSPKLVYQLVDVYFSKRYLMEDLVNKQKFLANLALPPTDKDFPHVSLVHAMCATATKFVEADAFELDKETYWRSEASPTDYHAAAAKSSIDNAIIKGEKLFNVAQAIILICFYSYSSARFVEVWLYCGLATRICAPLGLNHIESIIQDTPLASDPVVDTNKAPNNGQGVKIDDTRHRKREKQAGFAPQSEEDKAEQASVFWKAFVADRLATACTGWASSLAEDEISTLLPKPNPKPGPIQPVTAEEMEHLSISSPTFFTSNSLPLVDAPNLHYKSVILLGRVCAFLRSAPFPLGSDAVKSRRAQINGKSISLADVAASLEFKRLDALIVAFRLSFPKEFKSVVRKDTNGECDTNLVSAHVIPHAATILLHEAFCKSENDISMQRCLTSARAILSIIYLLWGSTYDISLVQPFITFCWAVAGRTLVRQLAFKQENEDELAAATLTQEINVILSAMSVFADRSPLGVVVASSLKALLSEPQSCHPRNNGGMPMGCGSNGGAFNKAGADAPVNEPVETQIGSSASSHATAQSDGGPATASSTDLNTPTNTFSGLLWELEQPGGDLGSYSDTKYKDADLDLRSLLGPSYDQLMSF